MIGLVSPGQTNGKAVVTVTDESHRDIVTVSVISEVAT